jgi:hypothetical protein
VVTCRWQKKRPAAAVQWLKTAAGWRLGWGMHVLAHVTIVHVVWLQLRLL